MNLIQQQKMVNISHNQQNTHPTLSSKMPVVDSSFDRNSTFRSKSQKSSLELRDAINLSPSHNAPVL